MSTDSNRFLIPKDPLLSWKFLAHRSRCVRLPGLAKTARRYLFFWGRNAIYYSLKALDILPGDRVLVPAYICAAAVEPILGYGAEAVFYEIRSDCLPDLADLEAKIDARTRAVLTVHYFGFPLGIQQFRALCDRHRLFLIEDCAHVLQGEVDGRPLGTFGEASVFSWRKFLPLNDGGELILNRWRREPDVEWRKESALFTLKVVKNLVDQLVGPTSHPAVRIPHRCLQSSKNTFLHLLGGSGQKGQALSVDSNSARFDPEMVDLPITRLSRLILDRSAIGAIAAKRRENYLQLQAEISLIGGIKLLFPDLPAGVCPWVLPLFFEGIPNAHKPLREMGIPAVTWGGVRHPAISRSEFPSSDFLYENLVFLPVHQDLQRKDLEQIVDAIKAVRQK